MPPTNNPLVPGPTSSLGPQPPQPDHLPVVPPTPAESPAEQPPTPAGQLPRPLTPQLQPLQQQPRPYQEAQPTQAPQYPAPDGTTKPTAGRYDFFLDPEKPKKSLKPAIDSTFKKILILAGGFILVLIIASVMLSISRSNKSATATLSTLVTTQQNIINTTDAALPSLGSTSLVNFATTAKITTASDQKQLIAYIAERGVKYDPKTLEKFTDPKVDEALSSAAAAGTYDSTFRKVMQTMLTDYSTSLQQIHDSSTIDSERVIIQKDLEAVKLLQQMLVP